MIIAENSFFYAEISFYEKVVLIGDFNENLLMDDSGQ